MVASSLTVVSASASATDKNVDKADEDPHSCDKNSPQEQQPALNGKQPKRIIRRRRGGGPAQHETAHSIDPLLLKKVLEASSLPLHAYQFEIVKTVQRCVALQATHIALQLPEGLLLYATVLADVLRQLASPHLQLQVSVLGDVTYGACCVDDITAQQLGCQLLVHYGHSCLVPLQHTVVPVLYVFVEIQISVPHLVDCCLATLTRDQLRNRNGAPVRTIYLLGTVQFRHALATAREMLLDRLQLRPSDSSENTANDHPLYQIELPQVKPLSPGEVLGCTSPLLSDPEHAMVCFVADGRFHLESTLIANPGIAHFYRYDPYSRTMTEEAYGKWKWTAIYIYI